MKKTNLLFLCILVTQHMFSQTIRFDSLYKYNAAISQGALAIVVEPITYLIGGVEHDGVSGFHKLAFLSIDLFGNIIYKKSYGAVNADYYLGAVGSMVKTYDDGYMLGGGTNDINGLQMAMLMKLDTNGDSLWARFYGDSVNDNFFYQIKQTNDSGFIGVGLIDPPGVALADIYIVKTDSIGNMQWQQQYGLSNFYDAAFSVQQTWDGGYIIGAERVPSSATNYDTELLRLDSAGNIKWQRFYGGAFDDYYPCVQVNELDTTYIAATNYVRSSISGNDNSVARFIAVNDSGATVWMKEYGNNTDYYLPTSFEKTFDGNYIAAGQGNASGSFGPNTSVLGRIFKISPQGDSLWYRSYYPSTTNCSGLCDQNYLRDIKPTPDGGYIACGFVADVFQDMWVIKIDSMGCVDTLCITTGFMEHKPTNIPVSVYPNPATNICTVKAPLFGNAVLSVYDLEGRILLKQEFNKESTIIVNGFEQGMYFIVLQNAKQRVVSKFIKE